MKSLSEHATDIAIKTLKDNPAIISLKDDVDTVYKYQKALYVYASNPDEAGLNTLRAGSSLAFAIIGKMISGKDPKDFTKDDWKDILEITADHGVLIDPQKYTEDVFELFAVYIDVSVDINEKYVNGDSAKEIKGIAEEIRALTKRLEDGEIREADYVDRCLWSSFEAMIKLLAAYSTKGVGEEYAEFLRAVADFSVQYGRLALYQRELELLNGYLEGQARLDEELNAQYKAYKKALQDKTDVFNDLIANAFNESFEQRLENSVSLARKSGVGEEKILDSQEKIDSFFMD